MATGRTVGEGDELEDEASDSEAESGSRVRMRNSFSYSSREDCVTDKRYVDCSVVSLCR